MAINLWFYVMTEVSLKTKNKKTIATIKTNNARTKIQVGKFSYPTKMNEKQKLP